MGLIVLGTRVGTTVSYFKRRFPAAFQLALLKVCFTYDYPAFICFYTVFVISLHVAVHVLRFRC